MSKMTRTIEHRWGDRISVNAVSELWSADGWVGGAIVRNVSLSGAYIETSAELPLLSCVSVRLFPRDTWLEACVVRRDSAGAGLEWTEPGAGAIEMLAAAQIRTSEDDAVSADGEVGEGQEAAGVGRLQG